VTYKNCPSTQHVHDQEDVLTVLSQLLQFCLFLQQQTDSLVPCLAQLKQEKKTMAQGRLTEFIHFDAKFGSFEKYALFERQTTFP
jgi:hypothetical protein